MFRIRDNHVKAFRAEHFSDFMQRALRHLRRDLPEQTSKLTDDQMRERVESCVRRATDFGLLSERQAICFVDSSFLLGIGFESDPRYDWAPPILKSDKLDPTDRAHLLLATACSVAKDQ